jgi:hypothetical protein
VGRGRERAERKEQRAEREGGEKERGKRERSERGATDVKEREEKEREERKREGSRVREEREKSNLFIHALLLSSFSLPLSPHQFPVLLFLPSLPPSPLSFPQNSMGQSSPSRPSLSYGTTRLHRASPLPTPPG